MKALLAPEWLIVKDGLKGFNESTNVILDYFFILLA